jgi:hypothetical protein
MASTYGALQTHQRGARAWRHAAMRARVRISLRLRGAAAQVTRNEENNGENVASKAKEPKAASKIMNNVKMKNKRIKPK